MSAREVQRSDKTSKRTYTPNYPDATALQMSTKHFEDEQPTTLRTARLMLRLADPSSDYDCEEILRSYKNQQTDQSPPSRISMDTVASIRKKHRIHGPKARYCTLAPPPRGMYFLIYLPNPNPDQQDDRETLVGIMTMCFRAEMPYPDLGYGISHQHQGNGYATEAGREVLSFWRDTVGVKEVCAMTSDDNVKSQVLAERIGFVKAGTVDVVFGQPPNESWSKGRVLVLPGMEWKDGLVLRPAMWIEQREDVDSRSDDQ